MCDDCDWEQVLAQIDDLIHVEDKPWIGETLDGIRHSILNREHVTTGQASEVQRIENIIDRRGE